MDGWMGAEERAEAALREEVTELQAKLEAAYKGAKQELALAKDKVGTCRRACMHACMHAHVREHVLRK